MGLCSPKHDLPQITRVDRNNNLHDLFWEGFELQSDEQLDARHLQIRLKAKASHRPTCSHDGLNTPLTHDFSGRRVCCLDCNSRREHIDGLPGHLALTQAMVNWVETLVRLMPVNSAKTLLGVAS